METRPVLIPRPSLVVVRDKRLVGSWELGVGSWELGVGSWELELKTDN